MSTNKSKFTFYLDRDVECVLSTMAVNFGLSRSKLLEFMILNAGFNLYGQDGLYNAWSLHYHPHDLVFYSDSSIPAYLSDVLLSSFDKLYGSGRYYEIPNSNRFFRVTDSTNDPVE